MSLPVPVAYSSRNMGTKVDSGSSPFEDGDALKSGPFKGKKGVIHGALTTSMKSIEEDKAVEGGEMESKLVTDGPRLSSERSTVDELVAAMVEEYGYGRQMSYDYKKQTSICSEVSRYSVISGTGYEGDDADAYGPDSEDEKETRAPMKKDLKSVEAWLRQSVPSVYEEGRPVHRRILTGKEFEVDVGTDGGEGVADAEDEDEGKPNVPPPTPQQEGFLDSPVRQMERLEFASGPLDFPDHLKEEKDDYSEGYAPDREDREVERVRKMSRSRSKRKDNK